MKKLLFLIIIAAFALSVNAQKLEDKDVPQPVKSKFAEMHPGVTNAKWEMENGKYEAEFKVNSVETSVLFEANGTYLLTETEIAITSLPAGVNEYAAKNLPGKSINEASMITNADGSVNYEAEIGKNDYIFDSNGSFLKKETDSSGTEDDDK